MFSFKIFIWNFNLFSARCKSRILDNSSMEFLRASVFSLDYSFLQNAGNSSGNSLNFVVISVYERRILSSADFFVDDGLNENLAIPAQIPAKVNPF